MLLYLTFMTAKVKIKLLSYCFPNCHGETDNLSVFFKIHDSAIMGFPLGFDQWGDIDKNWMKIIKSTFFAYSYGRNQETT